MGSNTGLYDGDGHVREDLRGIAERLGGPYRELRLRQLDDPATVAGLGSVFPSLGYLSSMPFTNPAVADRAKNPRESGDGPESWEYFLEAVGIERTVLYPTAGLTISRVRDHSYAIDAARAYNDWMAETYLRHPSGRFQAAALLPMQVPDAAVSELERAVTELGFCAGTLPAHGLQNHLGSDMYFPVYEAAQSLDVGLACHGGVHDGFGFDDYNVFAAAHALGHPLGLLVSLGGMLFNGVFDRFPRLRVAFLEGGSAWVLMAAERFSESFKASPPAESSRSLQLRPGTSVSDYMTDLLQSERLVLGCEGGEAFLETAIQYFGCAPFMYSSDFPHEVGIESCKHELEELSELKIDDDAKARLRGGTARTFYRL